MRAGLLLLAAFAFSSGVQAHSGGTDAYGCHNQTSTGTYHCHSGPLAGQSFSSKSAMLAVLSVGVTTTGQSTPSTSTGITVIPAYNREDYLPAWADIDGDCQDTRNDVLIAESLSPVTFDTRGCNVVSGRWLDPYTGLTFTNPADLDIDHLVPLSEAHKSGGFLWSTSQKREYANNLTNPLVLIAVDDGTNSSKGDKDPAAWLPPNTAYRCEYVKSWVTVKKSYGLAIDAAEQEAINAILPPTNSAVRTEAPSSWSARRGGIEAGAEFSIGVAKAGSCGFQQTIKMSDAVSITVEISPVVEHVGQVGNLYLVVRTNGVWLQQLMTGGFASWNGEISTLNPMRQNVKLNDKMLADIFTGKLNAQGQYQIYVGYSTVDGELIYTPVPIPVTVTQ